jgi:Nucleoside phosphorylase
MKNTRKKNELGDRYDLIGLEMEAAGIMNRIPVGVIRGVCDYGDAHKNKNWQPYAAAMAAAYAKTVLCEVSPRKIQGTAEDKHTDLFSMDQYLLAM